MTTFEKFVEHLAGDSGVRVTNGKGRTEILLSSGIVLIDLGEIMFVSPPPYGKAFMISLDGSPTEVEERMNREL